MKWALQRQWLPVAALCAAVTACAPRAAPSGPDVVLTVEANAVAAHARSGGAHLRPLIRVAPLGRFEDAVASSRLDRLIAALTRATQAQREAAPDDGIWRPQTHLVVRGDVTFGALAVAIYANGQAGRDDVRIGGDVPAFDVRAPRLGSRGPDLVVAWRRDGLHLTTHHAGMGNTGLRWRGRCPAMPSGAPTDTALRAIAGQLVSAKRPTLALAPGPDTPVRDIAAVALASGVLGPVIMLWDDQTQRPADCEGAMDLAAFIDRLSERAGGPLRIERARDAGLLEDALDPSLLEGLLDAAMGTALTPAAGLEAPP